MCIEVLIPWSRFLVNLTVPQLVKMLPKFTEPEGLSSQHPAACPCPDPHSSSPHTSYLHSILISCHFVYGFHLSSVLQVSPPNPLTVLLFCICCVCATCSADLTLLVNRPNIWWAVQITTLSAEILIILIYIYKTQVLNLC
jgi:hypothetical protein